MRHKQRSQRNQYTSFRPNTQCASIHIRGDIGLKRKKKINNFTDVFFHRFIDILSWRASLYALTGKQVGTVSSRIVIDTVHATLVALQREVRCGSSKAPHFHSSEWMREGEGGFNLLTEFSLLY